jgi:hypothetical protein
MLSEHICHAPKLFVYPDATPPELQMGTAEQVLRCVVSPTPGGFPLVNRSSTTEIGLRELLWSAASSVQDLISMAVHFYNFVGRVRPLHRAEQVSSPC